MRELKTGCAVDFVAACEEFELRRYRMLERMLLMLQELNVAALD
jgi:hypothetical protein